MIDYGDRARLGVLVPSGNAVAEPELRAMLPPGVGLMVNRLPLRGSSEAELLAMADTLEAAAGLLADARPDAISFHCTAVSTFDPAMADGLRRRMEAETGLRALATADALLAAVVGLGARRVLLVTPYIEAVHARETAFLEANGVRVAGGVFTPTEAAAVSCVYALPVGLFVERQLRLPALPGIFASAMRTSAVVCAIIAVSAGFGILVAQEGIAARFAGWMAESLRERWLALAALNTAFFLLAAVMDEIASMVILGPMLVAIANRFGVDPIHFGAIIVTNVSIGMAAPPIGYCLLIGMAISGLPLARISRAIWPQILVMLAVLFLTTYIPGFALLLQPPPR